MSGIISITEKKDWSAGNWAYWSLMDHLIDAFAAKPNVARCMEECKWMQCLSFPLLREEDSEIVEEVFAVLKSVAERCAVGELAPAVEGKPLDSVSQKQFRELMNDLVSMLNSET
jgi:hypothetical protein